MYVSLNAALDHMYVWIDPQQIDSEIGWIDTRGIVDYILRRALSAQMCSVADSSKGILSLPLSPPEKPLGPLAPPPPPRAVATPISAGYVPSCFDIKHHHK